MDLPKVIQQVSTYEIWKVLGRPLCEISLGNSEEQFIVPISMGKEAKVGQRIE